MRSKIIVTTVCGFLLLKCFLKPDAASAHLTSNYDFNFGFTSFEVKAADSFKSTLESPTTIDFNYNLNMSAMKSAFSLSFSEMVTGPAGNLPFVRLGLGYRYYVLGLNGQRIVLDNDTDGRIWAPTPFIGLTFGLATLSIAEGQSYFNASMVDGTVRLGAEIPIGSSWVLLGQFHYINSLALVGSSTDIDVSYSGIGIFAGLRLH